MVILTSWDKKSYNVPVNKDGRFQVTIKTPKAGGPYFIGFKDEDYVQLNNVMIGEVWICSGQSNMEMPMKGYKQQPLEGMTEELLNCKDNQLRLFTVKRHVALQPETDVSGEWFEANTASVREFSATAYYFGRALRRRFPWVSSLPHGAVQPVKPGWLPTGSRLSQKSTSTSPRTT